MIRRSASTHMVRPPQAPNKIPNRRGPGAPAIHDRWNIFLSAPDRPCMLATGTKAAPDRCRTSFPHPCTPGRNGPMDARFFDRLNDLVPATHA
jgi:hypothetical protein